MTNQTDKPKLTSSPEHYAYAAWSEGQGALGRAGGLKGGKKENKAHKANDASL